MTTERERIETLLVDETTQGLSSSEKQELHGLLVAHRDIDRYAYERAAAMVFLAGTSKTISPMPADLYARILANRERLREKGE